MSVWWWLAIGLVIWLAVGAGLALVICPFFYKHPLDDSLDSD